MDVGLKAAALSLLLALFPLSAAGQSAPESAGHEEARALFERGTAAVHAGRFARARVDLERSLALVPHPSTAFNLVVALRGLGKSVEAGEVCASTLEPQLETLDDARRREAEALCADVRAAIAHLTVRASGETPFELRVDGRSAGRLVPPEILTEELNAGEHLLTVLAHDQRPDDHRVRLPPGARITLELAADRPAGSSGLDVPLLVGLIGAGAAAVAGVIIAIVAASSTGSQDDYPVIATLLEL